MEKSNKMNQNILIIGGNGFVGSIIHNLMLSRTPGLNIIIGGRNNSQKSKNKIKVDVTNPNSLNAISESNISLIVLCTSDKENNVLKYCISNNIDYLDITKPTNELEVAHQLASEHKLESKVVFSSGWMSGIIGNLLKWSQPDLIDINEVKVFIYYSLDDSSGKTSADFMADNVSKPFKIFKNNKTFLTKYYLKPQYHNYSFGIENRKTYLFDTPDILILNQAENIPTVEIRTTYSSKFITWLLYAFQRLSIYNIIPLSLKKKIFTSNGKGDNTSFEVVYKTKNSSKKISIQNTTGQAELTAFSTVLHIERLINDNFKDGIYFSHQIHDNNLFIEQLLTKKSIKIIK
jgi:saccharopine dehydrogenase-like NADP-dependent oxidoreductase